MCPNKRNRVYGFNQTDECCAYESQTTLDYSRSRDQSVCGPSNDLTLTGHHPILRENSLWGKVLEFCDAHDSQFGLITADAFQDRMRKETEVPSSGPVVTNDHRPADAFSSSEMNDPDANFIDDGEEFLEQELEACDDDDFA